MMPIDPKEATMSTTIPPFVDGHVHFWNLRHPDVSYEWLGPDTTHPMIGDIDGLKIQRFAAEEFSAQSRFQNVTKAVHIGVSTNADPVIETRWLQSVADESGFPQGIVARCDLASLDAGETLLRHLESPNMRGVRDHGQPGSFDDPAWRRGYALLGDHDLVFCHEVGLDRMPAAVELVKAFPDVMFSLDHTSMPQSLDRDYFEQWRAAVQSMAAMPNAVMKVSAFGQWGRRWTLESVEPWVSACIEAFGTERTYFGTNFPVDGLFASYSDIVSAFRSLVAGYGESEQRALLAGNAERIYRLGSS